MEFHSLLWAATGCGRHGHCLWLSLLWPSLPILWPSWFVAVIVEPRLNVMLCRRLQVRAESDLKTRRSASHDADVIRQDSATDDVQLRHSPRHRRHDNRHDAAASVSRTRQERARLGLRDNLDELRLHDHPPSVSRHSVTSYDVTVTSRPRSRSPDVVTAHRKDVAVTNAVTDAAVDADNNEDGADKKPLCDVTSSLDVTSESSWMTSRLYGAGHLSTSGKSSFVVSLQRLSSWKFDDYDYYYFGRLKPVKLLLLLLFFIIIIIIIIFAC